MSQADVTRKEPYMKYYSPEEINKMCLQVADLLSKGKRLSGIRTRMAPLPLRFKKSAPAAYPRSSHRIPATVRSSARAKWLPGASRNTVSMPLCW